MLPPKFGLKRMRLNRSVMISRAIFTGSSHESSITAVEFLSRFTLRNSNLLIRYFCSIPRFDFGRIREPDDAVALFHEMVRSRPRPSVSDFSKLLGALVKIQHYSVALSLFDEMLQRKVPLNHYTLSIAVNCFCMLNRVDFGFAILGSFFKCGYQPTVVTFNTLIKGLFLVGKVAEAEILFKKLLRDNLCELNEVTYLTAIDGLCKAGLTLTALDLLRLLERGRCKPNIRAYSTIIDSLCKDGMVDEAVELFSKLNEKGVLPTVVTYSSLIQGLCKSGKWKEVKDLMNKMPDRKIFPDVVTCNILVDAYCKEGMLREASDVLETMVQIGVEPNVVTYNCLMNGYCRKGQVNEALQLFLEIPSRGLEHDVVSSGIMLQGLFRVGRIVDGIKFFKEMQARQLSPDIMTYNILLNGLCINDRVTDALSFLPIMEENSVCPDIVTYSILIDGMCKGNRLDKARTLFNELPSKGLQPNVVTFSILIGAHCQEGQMQEAKDLLSEMEKCGCSPDFVTYNIFVKSFLRNNELENAFPFLEEMIKRGFLLDSTTFSMMLDYLLVQGIAIKDDCRHLLDSKRSHKNSTYCSRPPSKAEIEEILKSVPETREDESENEENDENMNVDALSQNDELSHALSAANALGKALKGTNPETDSITEALKELDMDNYDEEDDGVELFGLSNTYYANNALDPYLKDGDEDSEEEEDITIKPEDGVIVCARNEDDVSHLEVWILEDPSDVNSNMYVHHDIVIPAFPLCTAWLDCPLKGGEKGNFIAVGSMEPAIEIWDLDIMDEVQPSATLGGVLEKKKKGKKKSIKYKDGSHTDSVLGLAWNKEYRNILASASADKLVKVWDVATETCNMTLENHTDKVQAVAWNHFAPQVLLSGSFDHSVVMKDVKIPSHSGFRWPVAADVESLAWDPHTEYSFVVSLENGMIIGFDIRTASSDVASQSKPCFTLHAHDKAVCAVAYNSLVPNLLATGSMDKMVKLWDLSNEPSCIASKYPKAGALFSISFSDDCPFTLAIGGSKGKLEMWDTLSDAEVSKRYGKYATQAKKPPTS